MEGGLSQADAAYQFNTDAEDRRQMGEAVPRRRCGGNARSTYIGSRHVADRVKDVHVQGIRVGYRLALDHPGTVQAFVSVTFIPTDFKMNAAAPASK
nr:hypothetical protein [Bradyrhizobium sp. 190]